MGAALALAARGRGSATPNPHVGCILVKDGAVVGRGWTAPGGRPHAEARALEQAGCNARGATAYVTLEPCAHRSARGPSCADLLVAAGVAEVAVAMPDPDPRTAGAGIARLEEAGIRVHRDICRHEAEQELAGFVRRMADGRPEITLKLAMSLDGRIALADGASQWITGPEARLFGHLLRSEADAVVVGGATLALDQPALTVRLPGWSGRQPARVMVGRGAAPRDWYCVPDIEGLLLLAREQQWLHLLVEGGGRLAGALLAADLVDRLALFRAPILLGEGRGIAGVALAGLEAAHGRWQLKDRRCLGADLCERFVRLRQRRAHGDSDSQIA
ncbi:MAG: bifunctional diaminohydroxyphosphoribosylaminopyrimidine deaminase/5-amino-6-(5-phosphoribosylamino)uracil reductase RibD [Sphingomonadaceae bacterium]